MHDDLFVEPSGYRAYLKWKIAQLRITDDKTEVYIREIAAAVPLVRYYQRLLREHNLRWAMFENT